MEPSTALAWGLNPWGRASFFGPVFFAGGGGAGRLRETERLSSCLLIRTIVTP